MFKAVGGMGCFSALAFRFQAPSGRRLLGAKSLISKAEKQVEIFVIAKPGNAVRQYKHRRGQGGVTTVVLSGFK